MGFVLKLEFPGTESFHVHVVQLFRFSYLFYILMGEGARVDADDS